MARSTRHQGVALIDLDEVLRSWQASPPSDWNGAAAERVARAVATPQRLRTDYDPPDEEWIRLLDDGVRALIHTRYPLALALAEQLEPLRAAEPRLRVVEISDYEAEELRASKDVLQATVLPYASWVDFDPERFSANDLFVESV
jgi:hypothetical protein